MRLLVGISRIIVGILFIISGWIKLNDPMGFSFKLEEYFEVGVLNLPFLVPYALAIAIAVVIFEVLLGIMLLVGYKPKFTVWSLLLMIVFFTFLTFYSAYFNKVTDCGCFGDAMKLTPWESFTKDIVLLVFILVLFFGVQHIKPLFSGKLPLTITGIALLASIWFANHVLNHLPSVDFRAYKTGVSIPDGMSIPEDAPKPKYDYHWKFIVDGNEKIITTGGDYPVVDGEFISVETVELEKGYEPPIHDFSIEMEGEDFTEDLMKEEKLLMVVSYNLSKASDQGFKNIKSITDKAISKGYTVIGMTASIDKSQDFVKHYKLGFEFFFTNQTTLKTIVRSNPGIVKVQKGVITQKLHFNDAEDLILD